MFIHELFVRPIQEMKGQTIRILGKLLSYDSCGNINTINQNEHNNHDMNDHIQTDMYDIQQNQLGNGTCILQCIVPLSSISSSTTIPTIVYIDTSLLSPSSYSSDSTTKTKTPLIYEIDQLYQVIGELDINQHVNI